jgi:crotonobetainyl-CoA:carnitine CoA-transferase CaiB-like acyl-CoA transferase
MPDPTWPPGPSRPGALAGLRVLELSRILAGPFAAMQLADLGADVIKVEAPRGGDETRRWGPPFVWLERLAAAGVPAAPINTVPEVFANPLVRERLLVEVGGVPQVRSPLRLDGRPALVDGPPPALGQDTQEVLRSLGLGDQDLARLRAAGAI